MGSGRESGSRKSQVNLESLKRILALGKKKIFANKHSACCFSHDVLKKLDHLFTSFYLHEGKQNTPPSVRVPACLPGWLEGSCLWHFRLPKA